MSVDGEVVASIDAGLLVLVGFTAGDDEDKLVWMTKKLTGLRIFEDEAGKMNRSVKDVDGSMLVVSQFTLYADIRKGKRPSFMEAAEPVLARRLYDKFCEMLQDEDVPIQTGVFGAMMDVDLCNAGPVTIIAER